MINIVIKSIEIKRFRGIKNFCLDFINGINIIEGKNGLGKSTILDAIKYMFCFNDNNIYFINEDLTFDKTPPDISMNLFVNEKEIVLINKEKNWMINNIFYKKNDYKQRLSEIFEINDVNLIISQIDPNNWLEKHLLSEKASESKEIRDSILKVINAENENIIDEKKFISLTEDISNLEFKIKKFKNDLKENKYNIAQLVQDNKDIDFEIPINNNNNYDYEIEKKYYEKLNEYNSLKNKIDLINANIKDLDIKNIKFENCINTNSSKKSFFDIILIIITLGIYYFFLKNKNNYSENESNKFQNNKKKEELKSKLKKELDELSSKIDKINNIEITEKLNLLKKEKEFAEEKNEYKLKMLKRYSKLNEECENFSENILKCENDKNILMNEKKELIKIIVNIFDNTFKSFKINLSDDINLIIQKNGVEFKKLNYSSKKI
ncbi:MAG: AAA family ATPase [Mycoplasmoidaceae bacterium]